MWMPPFSKYATASNLFSISWEAFLLEAKAYFPTTSIAGGFFMLKRTIKKSRLGSFFLLPLREFDNKFFLVDENPMDQDNK